MATNKKTPIPKEAIEGAAGISDTEKFSIQVIDTQIYFKDKDKKPYNVVSNKSKREILSVDLKEGMTIKAVTTKAVRDAGLDK